MKRWLILCFAFLVLIYTAYIYFDKGDSVDLESTQEELLSDIEKIEMQEQAYKWVHTSNSEDQGYLDKHQEDIQEKYRKPENVAKYLFATISMEDADLFLQSFTTPSISKDLFLSDEPDKMLVAEEMMNRISRNGTMTRVGIISVRGSVSGEPKVNVAISYEDNVTKKVQITMKKEYDLHHEEEFIYSINSSVWDMIKEIEG